MPHGPKALDLGSIDMHPSERLFVDIELDQNLARRWEKDHFYRAGDLLRPGNGFAYYALGDLTSGFKEPRWSVSIGTLVVDGSGLWQTRAANFDGLDIIISAGADLPADLSLFGVLAWEGSRIRIPIAGGVSGNVYECSVEADTQSGQTIVGMFAIRCSSERERTLEP
jgi:hypothetical protein